MVFENVGKGVDIYPSVGLRHTSESIRVNFGHAPFKYAIEDHVHAQRNTVWADIQSTKIDWDLLYGKERKDYDSVERDDGAKNAPKGGALEEEQMKAPVRKLVLSYLAHHGYARTARAFQAQCEGRRDPSTDHAMDTDDGPRASSSTSSLDAELDLRARIDIVNAVLKGDIDTALAQTEEHHPSVLEREQGLMRFKLRCRKFVELILEASAALKQVQAQARAPPPAAPAAHPAFDTEAPPDAMDGSGAMDVDDPSPEAPTRSSAASLDGAVPPTSGDAPRHPAPGAPGASAAVPPPSAVVARTALETAIAYGQMLETDYRSDLRPEVRSHLKRTFGVVAFADPLAAGGEVADMAGQEARARLANELNQAILGRSLSQYLVCRLLTQLFIRRVPGEARPPCARDVVPPDGRLHRAARPVGRRLRRLCRHEQGIFGSLTGDPPSGVVLTMLLSFLPAVYWTSSSSNHHRSVLVKGSVCTLDIKTHMLVTVTVSCPI